MRFNSVAHYTGGETQISYDARIHPNYNPRTFINDIGLIRVPQALTSIATRRIELPNTQNVNLDGRVAVLTAWGRDQSGETSPVLQYAWTHISLATAQRCRNLWSSNGQLPPSADNTAICATEIFEAQPPSRLCAGDSGSPLVIQDGRNLLLVGIGIFNSFDTECRENTSLFTRISGVRDWIRRETSV